MTETATKTSKSDKTTTLFLANLFLPSFHDYDVKMLNFTFQRGPSILGAELKYILT